MKNVIVSILPVLAYVLVGSDLAILINLATLIGSVIVYYEARKRSVQVR